MKPITYRGPKVPETKKWACAHWCVSPNAGTYTTVSNLEYTLVRGKRQTCEGREWPI
jgi:hypothetical protein